MVDSIALIRFFWDADDHRCRAVAYDAQGTVVAEVTIVLPATTRERIWRTHGANATAHVETIAADHLRAMLELRQ
jgi:hypothetical protein